MRLGQFSHRLFVPALCASAIAVLALFPIPPATAATKGAMTPGLRGLAMDRGIVSLAMRWKECGRSGRRAGAFMRRFLIGPVCGFVPTAMASDREVQPEIENRC